MRENREVDKIDILLNLKKKQDFIRGKIGKLYKFNFCFLIIKRKKHP